MKSHPSISPKNLLERLNWRYATKKFDPSKKISASDWETLAEVLRLAPSSYGLQPWKFLVVQNESLRKKLTPLSWNQTQVEDCSHFVVLASLKKVTEEHVKKFVSHMAEVRGTPVAQLDGYRDNLIADVVKGPRSLIAQHWTQRQCYIAMGSLMTAAALLHIDTCPMEGIDSTEYDQILGLKASDYASVAAVALGYRSDSDRHQQLKKVRYPAKEVIQIL